MSEGQSTAMPGTVSFATVWPGLSVGLGAVEDPDHVPGRVVVGKGSSDGVGRVVRTGRIGDAVRNWSVVGGKGGGLEVHGEPMPPDRRFRRCALMQGL